MTPISSVAIAIMTILGVSFAGSIGDYKKWDQFRDYEMGSATGECSTLSWLLPKPESGCCGRHAQPQEDNEDANENNFDYQNIGDTTYGNEDNVISDSDDYYQNNNMNDDETINDNREGAKCISDIINNVVNNVLDNIKDHVTTWVSGGQKMAKGIISLKHKNIIPNEIEAHNSQLTGLSSNGVVAFIAEGKQTGLRQYPWLVRFTIKTSYFLFTTESFCGGSLISSRFVLTAAHCVHQKYTSYDDVNIFLAEYNINTSTDCVGSTCIESVLMHPDKVIIHEAYQFQLTSVINDIALMRLRGSAPYTDYIRPICLPPFNIDVPKNEGIPLTIAGWGSTGDGPSPIKLDAQVDLVTHGTCQNYYSQLSPGQICAVGRTGQDVCSGDSGGPIMMEKEGNFYLVGVISGKAASSPCGSSRPAFYTNVFTYKKWIEHNMKV